MPDAMTGRTALRASYLGRITRDDVGRTLRLVGWVHRRRDLGGMLFLDLRDRTGLLQVSIGEDWTAAEALEIAEAIGHEDVVAVEGEIVLRPEPNPELPTGAVELRARQVERLGAARTPAIPVYRSPDEELPSEELRLKHRMLDLRRPELQQNLVLRHRLVLAARNYLDGLGFVEIETPILTRPTPEGARDYLVPSRVHPGEFYALPQSPQIYKQILMVAGFDRYFQIARCFRDEDLRADRQPEFTQIDLEASFVGQEDVLGWMEGLMEALARVADAEAAPPFPRLTWDEAMDRYGSDRPDLRWDLEISDFSAALADLEFRVVSGALDEGGRARGFVLQGAGARLSRKDIDALEEVARQAGAPGLLWVKRADEGGSGPLARFMGDEHFEAMALSEGDLALVAAGPDRVTSPALAAVRGAVIRALELAPEREHAWLWVTDFPLFDEENGRLLANHHPFVLPHSRFVDHLDDDPRAARGVAYDLVYNGSELGSGSLRVHDAALQRRILGLLGMPADEIESRFGFLLSALEAGAPPHGGVAFGVDRIVQRFAGASSLRDVMAFPKTTAARALFEGAPAPVDSRDLDDLGLRLTQTPGS